MKVYVLGIYLFCVIFLNDSFMEGNFIVNSVKLKFSVSIRNIANKKESVKIGSNIKITKSPESTCSTISLNKPQNRYKHNKKQSLSEYLSKLNAGNSYHYGQKDRLNHKRHNHSITKKINDGYWELLQDWSQCSLKCGGGISTQQWMCVPPRNGGKPCEGKSIRTKPCNTHPCPLLTNDANSLIPFNQSSGEIILKPIIATINLSPLKMNELKCKLQEIKSKKNGYSYKSLGGFLDDEK